MTPRRITQIAIAVLATAFAAAPSPPLGYPKKGVGTETKEPDYQGIRARVALDKEHHIKNVGGSDGLGLCVFTSMQYTGWYQDIPELQDMQAFMRPRPGGGWPEKVDDMLAQKLGPNHGLEYFHATGDLGWDLAVRAAKLGYKPCVTMGYSDRYGVSIDHMVVLAHADNGWVAFEDNNFPGTWEWVEESEAKERYMWGTQGKGAGWTMVFLANPQPPEPK